MRALVLLLAVSASAVAQPAAADSALVDRVLLAFGYDLEADAADGGPPGPLNAGVLAREAFLEDVDAVLLKAALAFFDTPAWAHLEGPPSDRAYPTDPDARADSVFVVDYVVSRSRALDPADVWAAAVEEEWRALSGADRRALDALHKEMDMGTTREWLLGLQRPRTDSGSMARWALSAVDPSDLEAVAAFYRSDAGRYVGRRDAVGRGRASVRDYVERTLDLSSRLH